MCKIALLRSIPRLIAFAALLFFSAASGTAFADVTLVSPSIGLTAGQTARLSVVNNGTTTESETLTLFDDMGNMLATKTEAVDPGHGVSLDFTTSLAHLEIHGTVLRLCDGGNVCTWTSSLQIFDSASLESMVLVENFQLSPPLSPLGTGFVSPSIGLTAGQTARLSVVNDATATETQTLQIMNAMGAIVAERIVTIAPGEVGSVDFTTASARMEIHGKASPGGFPVDLQIFDSTSMRTTALVENFLPSPPETTATLISPSIGLAAGQIARLSVVNTNSVSETETLSIVDGRGITLKTATLTVAPGRTVFIQVRTSNPRLEVHGRIHGELHLRNFPASLQVYDAGTLETMALVDNFLPSPPETTTEPLTSPSIGFGVGQTARLSIVNTNTVSETQTLSIVNDLGVTLRTATVTLAPGRTAFIQTTTSSPRLEIHCMINAAAPQSLLAADLQIFDSTTQKNSRPRMQMYLWDKPLGSP